MSSENSTLKNFKPSEEPSGLKLAQLWTNDPELQKALMNPGGYLKKLSLIGNSQVNSPFSLNAIKISEAKFQGTRNLLDVSNGEFKSESGTYAEFDYLTKKMHAVEQTFSGKNIGTALEVLFTDLNHLLFGNIFETSVSSTVSDLTEQTDTIFFLKPFDRTKFLFGLDFTISKGTLYDESKIDEKLDKFINQIKHQGPFSLKFVDHQNDTNLFTASHVPKLVCYLNPEKLEEIAEHYYKMDHEKVMELIQEIREDILISLYLEALLLQKYALANNNLPMHDSYRKLKIIFMEQIPREKRKWIVNSPVVGELVLRLWQRNIKTK